MRILTKSQIKEELGGYSPGLYKNIRSLRYLGGSEGMDQVLNPTQPQNFELVVRERGIEFSIFQNFKFKRIGIKFEDLEKIAFESKEQIYEKKDRSVVGRALVGGILLGPLGAIVGGMTGLKDGQKAIHTPDTIISFIHKVNGEEQALLLTCAPKKEGDVKRKFYKYLEKYMLTD